MPAVPELPSDLSSLNGARRVSSQSRAAERTDRLITPKAPDRADSVEISDRSRVIGLIREPQPVRETLIASVRDQIARDAYLTDARIDGAVDEILRDFNELG
jgi:hypothetical protein